MSIFLSLRQNELHVFAQTWNIFIGVLPVITWLILLLRYPARACPVSVAAAVGQGLVAMWVMWLDNREIK